MAGACEGRVAIVTGASRGIGAVIAARLAEEGARVVATARTLEPSDKQPGSLTETVQTIRDAGGEAVPVAADLSKPEDRARIVAEAERTMGPVDILVNDAAVSFLLPFDGFPEKRYRLMFEVQVHAPFELTRLVLPGMRARKAGWILNITSRAAIHPPGPPYEDLHTDGIFTVYGMCKAALERLTTGLAAEVYADGVAVNALAPWDIVVTHGAAFHDLTKYPTEGPEWIAEAALALCSGPPATMTGRLAYSQQLLAELKLRPKARIG